MVLSAVCVVGCFISAGSVRGIEARMGFYNTSPHEIVLLCPDCSWQWVQLLQACPSRPSVFPPTGELARHLGSLGLVTQSCAVKQVSAGARWGGGCCAYFVMRLLPKRMHLCTVRNIFMTRNPAFFVQSLAWSAARVCWLLLAGQGRWFFLFLVDVFVRFSVLFFLLSSFLFLCCCFCCVWFCVLLSVFLFSFCVPFFFLFLSPFSFFFLCSVSCSLFCVARPVAGPPASIWPGLGWILLAPANFYSPYFLFPSGSLQVAGRLNHRCIPDLFWVQSCAKFICCLPGKAFGFWHGCELKCWRHGIPPHGCGCILVRFTCCGHGRQHASPCAQSAGCGFECRRAFFGASPPSIQWTACQPSQSSLATKLGHAAWFGASTLRRTWGCVWSCKTNMGSSLWWARCEFDGLLHIWSANARTSSFDPSTCRCVRGASGCWPTSAAKATWRFYKAFIQAKCWWQCSTVQIQGSEKCGAKWSASPFQSKKGQGGWCGASAVATSQKRAAQSPGQPAAAPTRRPIFQGQGRPSAPAAGQERPRRTRTPRPATTSASVNPLTPRQPPGLYVRGLRAAASVDQVERLFERLSSFSPTLFSLPGDPRCSACTCIAPVQPQLCIQHLLIGVLLNRSWVN